MSLFTSVLNAFSSQQASKAEKRAAQAAAGISKAQYEETRGDLAPYRNSGAAANSQYTSLLGLNGDTSRNAAFANYQTDPSYDWQRNQAINSVQGSAAARGSLFSGNTLRGISDRTQNIANLDYGNYLQRLSGLSEQGRSAAVAGGQFGANAAVAQGGYAQDVGRANASSIIAPALGWNQFNNNAAQAMGAFAR